MAKLVKILEEGITDLENELDVIASIPTIKFRPLTASQEKLYGSINPQDFSVQAALKNAEEMVKKSEQMVRNLGK